MAYVESDNQKYLSSKWVPGIFGAIFFIAGLAPLFMGTQMITINDVYQVATWQNMLPFYGIGFLMMCGTVWMHKNYFRVGLNEQKITVFLTSSKTKEYDWEDFEFIDDPFLFSDNAIVFKPHQGKAFYGAKDSREVSLTSMFSAKSSTGMEQMISKKKAEFGIE